MWTQHAINIDTTYIQYKYNMRALCTNSTHRLQPVNNTPAIHSLYIQYTSNITIYIHYNYVVQCNYTQYAFNIQTICIKSNAIHTKYTPIIFKICSQPVSNMHKLYK